VLLGFVSPAGGTNTGGREEELGARTEVGVPAVVTLGVGVGVGVAVRVGVGAGDVVVGDDAGAVTTGAGAVGATTP